MTESKTYTVDCRTWRAGGDGNNKVGEGLTRLLNQLGFMCCLGQCALQEGVSANDLRKDIPGGIEGLRGTIFCDDRVSSELSIDAMVINDDESINTQTRMKKLRALFREHGQKLRFIHQEALER